MSSTTSPFLPPAPSGARRWWDSTVVAFVDHEVKVTAVSDGEAIVGMYFDCQEPRPAFVEDEWVNDAGPVASAIEQLQAYTAGDLTEFDLPLRPAGTDFQIHVWESLIGIPYGVTTTYGRIANDLGRPTGSRAVGAAVGANPIGIVVPCHRVIGANGSLTGYAGGMDNKISLLRLEGVTAV